MNGGEALKKDLTPEEFERFRDWIHKHSGIYLEEQKADSLRISLVTRATRFGFLSYDEYFRFLSVEEAEFRELMNLVTINETSFFRFPAQFDALRDRVIPEILESKPKIARQFRVWSAGCSTGEEPYTIAMSLLDSGLEAMGYRTEVFGTDVSTQALDKARAAVYPARSIASIPDDVRSRWFEQVTGGYRPVAKVRDTVELAFHNLIKEPYPLALLSNWDVVFCRNVTIYFRLESTRRVVNNFFESLNPGGYLFIGHSETLTSISDRFEPVEIGGVFLYRKPLPRRLFTFDDVMSKRRPKERARTADMAAASRPERPHSARNRRLFTAEKPVPAPAVAADSEPATEDPLAEAQARLGEGQPREALRFAEQAMRDDAQDVRAILVAAYAHADIGMLDRAIEEGERALSINPLLAPARYVLGVIYLQQGDLMRALNEFKRTIYIDKDFVLAHFNVANIYRQKGALEDACREYENTIRALAQAPEGEWTAFLGGFRADLLQQTCERSLIECRKGRG
jgi:chemotaxis protein methyltransferase CheR